jgi:transposase
VTDFVEMFRHWNAGRSQVQIYQALNIDRKTIRKYLAPALAEGLQPHPAEAFDEELWRERIRRWFPELVDPVARALTWPQIAAHHQWITGQLKVPVTVATIAQRLRDDHHVEVSESTVRRYIATTFTEQRLEERVTVPRGAVEPGSEAQIDYGKLGMWFDPASGRRVAVWVFAMILSCSRALFVQPVLRMDQSSWNASHVAAFQFFGGVPARLVCDNLKTGVTRPDLYDPQINLAYGELAAFYGTLIDPARARKPKDKPRIERPIPYIRDSFFAGRDFTSLTQMQADAIRWATEVYGVHKHRGMDGQTPTTVFTALERDALIRCRPECLNRSSTAWGGSPRTATSNPARRCTRCRGGSSASKSPCAPPVTWCSSSTTTSWWPPTCCTCRDDPRAWSTIRRTRSPTPCAA